MIWSQAGVLLANVFGGISLHFKRSISVASVIALSGVALAALGPISASAGKADPALIQAVVTSPSGDILADALVTVYGVPNAGPHETVVLTTLGSAVSDVDGQVNIAAGADNIDPALVRDDGTVELEIDVNSSDSSRIFNVVAFPPTDAESSWTWSGSDTHVAATDEVLVSLGVTDEASSASRAEGIGEEPAVPIALSLSTISTTPNSAKTTDSSSSDGGVSTQATDPEGPDIDGTPDDVGQDISQAPTGEDVVWTTNVPSEPAPNSAGVGAGGACKTDYDVIYVPTSTLETRMVRLQSFHTKDLVRATYAWSTTENTKISASYKSTTQNYALGLTDSIKNETSTGVVFQASYNDKGYFEAEWAFKKYRRACSGRYSFNRGVFYTGSFKWVPYQFTGGNLTHSINKGSFTCDVKYKTAAGNQVWAARNTTRTITAAATLFGTSLDVEQENSTDHRLTLTPKSGHTADLCGSDNYAIYAKQAREV